MTRPKTRPMTRRLGAATLALVLFAGAPVGLAPTASAAPTLPPSVGNSVLFHLQLATDIDGSGNPVGQGTVFPEGTTVIFGLLGWNYVPVGTELRLRLFQGDRFAYETAMSWSTRPDRAATAPASSSRSRCRRASRPATTTSRLTTTASPTRSCRSRLGAGNSSTRSSGRRGERPDPLQEPVRRPRRDPDLGPAREARLARRRGPGGGRTRRRPPRPRRRRRHPGHAGRCRAGGPSPPAHRARTSTC